MSTDLEALLHEHRKFEPSDAFRAAALLSSPDVYAAPRPTPRRYWAEQAATLEWIAPWQRVLDWKPPHAKWFVGGKLNVVGQLPRPAHPHAAAQQGRAHLGGRAGRSPHAHVLGPLRRGQPVRATCSSTLGVKKGDRVGDLPADDPRGRDRDARLRAHRRDPLGGVRRLLARVAARPHQRRAVQGRSITADGGYRRGQVVPLKRNADKALEEAPSIEHVVVVQRRPGATATRRSPRCRRDATTGGTGSCATRRCGASPSRWTPRTCCSSSTPPAPPASRRASCTRPAATSPARRRRRRKSCSTSRRTTSSGARPTSAGSPDTRISSTARSRTARRA